MRNALVALGVLLVTLLAGLFAVPYFVDWNSFRGTFEEELSRVVGRDVRVSGRVNLILLPSPRFDIERVRIADPGATSGEPFARIERIEARVAVAPLLRGVLEATEINLVNPQVRLVLDGKGSGNWQSLTFNAKHIPLIRDIALQSVTISGGEIAVYDLSGTERARVGAIAGDLSATALEGPYRFRGSYRSGLREREVRFATAKPDPDGSTRLKGSLKFLDTALTTNFDGKLTGGASMPKLEGELTAELPIPRVGETPPEAIKPRANQPLASPAELRTRMIGTPDGIMFEGVTIAFEQQGRPQTVTGSARASWLEQPRFDAELTARWLDLDSVLGIDAATSPARALLNIASTPALRLSIEPGWQSSLRVTVEQGLLGREQINGFEINLVTSPDQQGTAAPSSQTTQPTVSTAAPLGETTRVEVFRIGLPGGSRIDLTGRLNANGLAALDPSARGGSPRATATDEPSDTFQGVVSLSGASLSRFITWASSGQQTIDQAADGTFAVRMNVALAPKRAAVTDVRGELGGTSLSGAMTYDWRDARRRLNLTLDGQSIDIRPLFQAPLNLETVTGLVRLVSDTPDLDAALEIRTGQLKTRGRTYKDVDARLRVERQKLVIDRVTATLDNGLYIDADGDFAGLVANPTGALRFKLDAETPTALASARELLGFSSGLFSTPTATESLLPFSMAGTLTLQPGERRRSEIKAQGTAGGVRLNISTIVDGPLDLWRERFVDVALRVESADPQRLFAFAAQLSPAARGLALANRSAVLPRRNERPQSVNRLAINALGLPASGMQSRVSLETGDAAIDLRGILTPLRETTEIAGDLTMRALDGSQLVGLLPDLPRLGLERIPVNGRARIVLSETSLALSEMALSVGDTDIAGSLTLVTEPAATGPPTRRVEAKLETSKATVAGLLAPMMATAPTALPVLPARAPANTTWPDTRFDFTSLDRLDGTIEIKAQTLGLTPSMTLGATELEFRIEAGKLYLKQFNAETAHGRWSGALRLERATIGGQLSGVIRLADGQLAALSSSIDKAQPSAPAVTGPMAGFVTVSGRGPSLSAVFEALEGKGTLDVGELKVISTVPSAIEVAAEQLLRRTEPVAPEALRAAIEDALVDGTLIARPARYALTVIDGALRIVETTFDLEDGRIIADAVVDLNSLTLLSTWKLEARRIVGTPAVGTQNWTTQTRRQSWPSVTLIVSGALSDSRNFKRQLLMDEFVREFTVRKVERDVEELERLRKLDEQRVREEAERRQRLAEPPVPTAAVPAPGPALGPAPFQEPTPGTPQVPPFQVPAPAPAPPAQR